jgi:hypothetical protein
VSITYHSYELNSNEDENLVQIEDYRVTRQWKAQDIIRNNCNNEKVINKQHIYIYIYIESYKV